MNSFLADAGLIDRFYKENTLQVDWGQWFESEPTINSYHLFKGPSKNSAITRYIGNDQFKLVNNKTSIQDIKPQDVLQTCLVDALSDNTIKIVVVTGCAGSGKSLLAIAYGLDQIKYRTLMYSKPAETIKQTKFFATVPGSIPEKYAPFLDSFYISAKKVLGDKSYLDNMIEKGHVVFKPTEFMRGDTYDDTTLIIDESQNLEWHSTKTALTRMGENSKVILLGDTTQKDVRPNDKSGMELLRSSRTFKNSSITVDLHLINDYRSDISRLVSSIDKEISY